MMISKSNIILYYTSYIFKNIIKPFLLIITTLTGIIWLMQSLRFLDYIVNKGLGTGTFFYLSSLLLPSILIFILPISLFCGILYTYNKLISDNELVILQNSGLNNWQIARPAIIFAIMIMLITYVMSLYVLPLSYRNFKELQNVIKNNYASLLLQEGVFNNPIKGLTVYIDSINKKGVLEGIFVHDNRTAQNPTTMMAQQGTIINTPKGNRLLLSNGNRQEINNNRGELNLLYFDKYNVDLSHYTSIKSDRVLEPQERFLSQLFYPEDFTNKNVKKNFINILKAEGHQRIIWPLYNLSLALLAVVGILIGKFNRRGLSKKLFYTSTIAAIIIITAMIMSNLASNYHYFIYLMYILALLALLINIIMLLPDDNKIKINIMYFLNSINKLKRS